MTRPKLLEAALWYAKERNWPVLPLHTIRDGHCTCSKGAECRTPGKHPRWDKALIPDGLKSASTDPERIRAWWGRWPDANIGVATGKQSFDVLDVDLKGDGDGTLADLVVANAKLPDTVEQITGSGGRQIMFSPSGRLTNAVRFADGLDIRADGGLVVAPPSLHISGNRYEWEVCSKPSDVGLAPMPTWLIELIVAASRNGNGGGKAHVDPVEVWAGIPEGKRDHELFRYACRLRTQGLNRQEVECLVIEAARRCKPPFPDADARAKVESAWRYPEPEQTRTSTTMSEAAPDEPDQTDQSPETPACVFPASVMSGFAGDFADLFSSHTEAPIQFYFFACLTCLGNVLCDRLTVSSQIAPQPRFYTLLLGESADDRKSTAISQTVRFFDDFFGKGVFPAWHGIGSAEALAEGANGRLLLVFDEFKAFVGKCKIDSSILLPAVASLFEKNTYENHIKKKHICIDNAYLSILAASTIDTYQQCWSSSFTDIGFNNRLWLVTGKGERRFSIPPKIPYGEIGRLRDELKSLLSLAANCYEMPIEADAQDLYHQWYMSIGGSIHSRRLDGYALRLMPLMAVNDGRKVIDLDIVSRVIKLCDWQLQVRKLHDPIDADNAQAKMEQKIRRLLQCKSPLRERDLKRGAHADRDGLWIYNQAKNNLLKAGEISFDRKAKGYAWLG